MSRINYGCTIADNSEIGFRDRLMDAMLVKRQNAADLLRELDRPAWSCSANMRRWAGRCIEKSREGASA
ncbi:MAG: hypothetical protein IKH31_00350 [Clostridia bacterium]|nr:hypothetical protein [Clostridia bacterium]